MPTLYVSIHRGTEKLNITNNCNFSCNINPWKITFVWSLTNVSSPKVMYVSEKTVSNRGNKLMFLGLVGSYCNEKKLSKWIWINW